MSNIYAHKNTCKAGQKMESGTTDVDKSPVKMVKLEPNATGTGSVSSEDEMILMFINLVFLIILLDGIKVLHGIS